MDKIIEWFARNAVAANLLMIGMFIGGFIGFMQMEREIEPTVKFNGLQIAVNWPGAGPQEVEDQIITRIEEAVSDLDNIDWVRSISREGSGTVWMLAYSNVDFTQFLNEVKNRVDGISGFPRDIEPPRVVQWENNNEFIRIAVSGDVGERELKRTAEQLRKEVARLPAISLVELFGVREEEVSIEVSEDALRRYNLTFEDVSTAIAGSSVNLATGNLRTEAGRLQLITRNRADTQREFENIIVRETADGGVIRVRDVATVIDGFEDNEILATLNGKPTVLIQVLTTEVMDIVTASDGVNKWIKERQETLPKGMELTLWTDQAETFNDRMSLIGTSALQGLVLVFILLLLTLRPIVAVWVTLGIATAYAGAFVLLPAVDVSLNMLSTFAFLLVLGIVVDDAIVVGESIHTESQKTGGGMTAAVLGGQLVAKPVIFAVLTTIIAFLPWIWISGGTSEFTRHITWVVILALAFSLVESLLILPAHLRKLKPRTSLGRFGRFQKRIADSIQTIAQKRYYPLAKAAARRRWLTLSSFIGLLIIAFFGLQGNGYVKQGFLPDIESDEVNIDVTLPDGTPYSRALQVLDQMQRAQRQLKAEVEAEYGADSELIENWYTRSRRDSVIAIVKLAPPEVRALSAKDVAIRLRELMGDVPDAEELNVRYTDQNNDPGLEFSISHPDLGILREAADDFMGHLRTYDKLYDVRDNLTGATDELRFSLKPGAQKLGITLRDLSSQIRAAYFGLEVQRLPRDGEDVRVYVRYPRESRRNLESLKNFRVRTADGREVPLEAVANLDFAPGINQILHWDGRRATIVSARLKEEVRGEIMEDLNENFFPDWEKRFPGIQRGAIGQAEGEKRFFQEVMTLYFTAFFMMYMLLAIAFRSYGQPILFLIAIPFAVVGAILGHLVLGEVMSIFSYFGIAAAAGVVINDNLVLVDYCNRLRERGLDGFEAITEAGVKRFRPILLTTLTTIVGLMPMLLERSIQAAFLKPIVIALMFGVGIAFFVTLLLVPALYMIGIDIKRFFGRIASYIRGLFSRGAKTDTVGRAPAE